MAKKKSKSKFKLNYDAPVSLSFAIISILLLLVDLYLTKGNLNKSYLLTPTTIDGTLPFSFTNPLSYLRLLLHIFGGTDKIILISNLIFVILLGPEMEIRYGSVIIGIMIFVAALFSGVLNACFCKNSVSGAEPVVFMLIILDIMMHLTKKTIPVSAILIVGLFIAEQILIKNSNGNIGVMITLAGGLCGSLLAFMSSPKSRTVKKQQKTDTKNSAENNEPTFSTKKTKSKKSEENNSNSDETIVGTIEL